MPRPLRIVIVSYVDDNFGDNLIRISFQALLEVALDDHGLSSDDYEIVPMPLKSVDEDVLGAADAIFFAGGGLFGLSYLNFFEHLEHITDVAERRGIPVVFSSMGLNNMDAEEGSVDAIAKIVTKPCVKAVAVRENLRLFKELVTDVPFEVRQVADPAVWTKYVYGMTDVVPDGTLGVNVVRGGLFVANQRQWGLTAEMTYLAGLQDHAEAAGLQAFFYTNGSLGDNNTLRYFAREHDISRDRVVLPQTTREVVEAIASRSAVASIRMHSSIIAYSFGIPTVALEWNDKLPHFYEAIGHPERVIPFGEWSPERSFDALRQAGTAPEIDPRYREYAMSTYEYVFGAVGEHVLAGRSGTSSPRGFTAVADALVRRSRTIDEDEFDLRHKMGKAERAYLGSFIKIRESDRKIREYDKKLQENDKRIRSLTARVAALTEEAAALSRQTGVLEKKVREQKRELDQRFTTRLARFVRRVLRRVAGRGKRPTGSPSSTR